MRFKPICSACGPRSSRYLLPGRVYLSVTANTFPGRGFRQISTQTRTSKKNIAGAATASGRRGQKWTHASVATSKPDHSVSAATPEVSAASRNHVAPEKLNPENDLSSTLPAPLVVPDGPAKGEDGSITLRSRVSYLYKLGKAYVGFYKTGVKNIWFNYKQYRELQARLGGTNIHDLVKYASTPSISRRDYQLYLRTRHDLKKLPPFALVFLICGEFTPLVILALGTSIVPYTCRIPKQINKDLQKTLTRIELAERQRPHTNPNPALAYIHGLDPFGLSIRNTPILGPLLRNLWINPKLRQHMEQLICDATLIAQEGGASRLTSAELFQLGLNLKAVPAIQRFIHHHQTQGAQSPIPNPDVPRAREELQPFLDGVQRSLADHRKHHTTAYDPIAIFIAAAQHARSGGGEGAPYLPPSLFPPAREVASE
jgi:hypothetical protein